MPSSAAQSVLFFRVYREIALPLYAALVEDLCGSSFLPFQLATVLEDIGQGFVRLAEQVNAELMRRGVLDREAEADATVEAQIDRLLAGMTNGAWSTLVLSNDKARLALTDAVVRQAFRIALIMAHDLPVATDGIRARPLPGEDEV